jgi:uncharacterized SAM-binding protein YcdF (DUF218 family)
MRLSAHCASTEQAWLSFKHQFTTLLFHRLPGYGQIALILLLVVVLGLAIHYGLRWLCAQSISKRFLSLRRVIAIETGLLVLSVLILSPPGVSLAREGLLRFVPPDTNEPADAIVVLGRGKKLSAQRVPVVAELWQAKRAPVIFASGRRDAPVILKALSQRGIPSAILMGEDCSLTTEENAKFSAIALKQHHIQKILLVTDDFHMLRSRLTFQSFGFQVISHRVPTPMTMAKHLPRRILVEYGGLISYGLRGRFLPRHLHQDAIPNSTAPSASATNRPVA